MSRRLCVYATVIALCHAGGAVAGGLFPTRLRGGVFALGGIVGLRAAWATEKSAAVRILADFFTVSSDIRAKVMINVN